jgi:hypothetical protein
MTLLWLQWFIEQMDQKPDHNSELDDGGTE